MSKEQDRIEIIVYKKMGKVDYKVHGLNLLEQLQLLMGMQQDIFMRFASKIEEKPKIKTN